MKELYVESGTQDSHLLEEEELRTVISAKVAINECIEMAKKFGSDGKATKLVNGVLDRIARDHRTAEIAKK